MNACRRVIPTRLAVLATSLATLGALLAGPSAVAAPAQRAADSHAAGRSLSPADFYEVLTVSDPQVSPDGRWVAYVVTGNDRASDAAQRAVWMVDWDGGQPILLTQGLQDVRAPRWSPDGRYLTFLASHGSDNAQLMALDRRGGEAVPLTPPDRDVDDYAWSPDGRHVALVMQRPRGTEQNPKPSIQPIVIDALQFKQDEEGYLGAGQGLHLYLLDLGSRQIEPLTADGKGNERLPAWAPDGRRLAFVSTRERETDADGLQDIDVIDVPNHAAPRRLVRIATPNRQRIQWSPDGTFLAYLVGEEAKYNQYIQNRLGVVAATGGPTRLLAQALDRPVSSFAIAHDSQSVWTTVDDDGRAYAARVDVKSGDVVPAPGGPFVASAVSEAAGHVALLYSDDSTLPEVYALEAGRLRPLTHHNDPWATGIRLREVEDLRFRSKDGTGIHGLLVKPPDYTPGRRYPTVLWIHGGPNGQDAHALTSSGDQFKRQLLAAEGYVVFGINYRGSSGRGRSFAHAIAADWGHKEVEDLLAGVDHLMARGIADPERLGIGGWSYGAILTDYVIARDPRFKAAVSGAGSANLFAMYGTDQYILQYNQELGVPWAHTARWLEMSYPFFHADRIRTPTLFMGGTRDFDVPLIGGEQMYQALRTLGIPAQLVVYPGEFHQLKRPSFLEDRARRVAGWFDARLKP